MMRREHDVNAWELNVIRNRLHEVSVEIAHPDDSDTIIHAVLDDRRDVVRR